MRAGVNERTLRRWMAEDEEFNRELAEARRSLFQAGMNRVQALTGQAVDTLAALLAPDTPAEVRLGAARTVAELGLHQRGHRLLRGASSRSVASGRAHGLIH